MKAAAFWKALLRDKSDFLDRIVALLREHGFRYCVIGGVAVNAYAEPVASLGLDIVVAPEQVEGLEELLRREFQVESFAHSLNISDPGSDLRIQIQTDPRYFDFVGRATAREVMGVSLPVAAVADVLRGKVWAASDPTRRPSKRLKDLADIARLLEGHPDLSASVPPEILARLH